MERPTPAELAVLQVLWEQGPSTVAGVLEVVHDGQPTRYTTVLKTLQNMHTKGLVAREPDGRRHVYRASLPREQTQGELVVDLVRRAFSGSGAALVSRALEDVPVSKQEISELRALLDDIEERS